MSQDSESTSYVKARQSMVEQQIAARGIRSDLVLEAMARVPREAFLPHPLREFAYVDSPLPIGEGQTISQACVVALMVEALELEGGERALEVGTGSGYAAAILAQIADEVFTVERHGSLAADAREVLEKLGCDNVQVIHSDGSLGWPDAAPYEAIMVAAGGPSVPEPLKRQLAVGGRLVIPVGPTGRQTLVKVTRRGSDAYDETRLADVSFVALVGREGWKNDTSAASPGRKAAASVRRLWGSGRRPAERPGSSGPATPDPRHSSTPELIASAAEPIADATHDFADVRLDGLLERIGDARVVLIGEASHGTSEFYRFRARITRALIAEKDFDVVAVEADWPDAAHVDDYVRHRETPPSEWQAFSRFPAWMWRNRDVADFVDWLREHNAERAEAGGRVGFHGLDLYSLHDSVAAVLRYLDGVDAEAARVARERYGCLTPWQKDPATYGQAAASGRYRECQDEVAAMLSDLGKKRMEYTARDGDRFLDAIQNARLVTSAERYYRSMYEGYGESWNLRDRHMFETLKSLLEHRGTGSRAVVWAHNSHVGDATATDMARRGQYNIGQLCREDFGDRAYLIGFGTHTGTVAAATDWDGPMEVKRVRPSMDGSWERLCHDSRIPAFMMGLRQPEPEGLRDRLLESRLERAIGVIYRPETERASHYFMARLASQFDEFVWFDETRAVTPLQTAEVEGLPETWPFGV